MIFSSWLHVIGAVILLGGLLFQSHVVVPLIKADSAYRLLWVKILRQSRRVTWTALGLLFLTGLYNFSRLSSATILKVGPTLGLKLALVLLLLFLFAHRDFGLTARMIRTLEEGGDPLPLQRTTSWIDRCLLLLGLAVLFFGLELAHINH